MQHRLEGKVQLCPAASLDGNEVEITRLAAGDEPQHFLDVLGDMSVDIGQQLGVAGSGEGWNFRQDRLAQCLCRRLPPSLERPPRGRQRAGWLEPGERPA
jgi:hypothetical protein